ncbi:MAG: hypothetical protein KGL39_28920 [Patescibacteria group bacterium]|nr:hypothetical protein [Patescibacteria group bacterium]
MNPAKESTMFTREDAELVLAVFEDQYWPRTRTREAKHSLIEKLEAMFPGILAEKGLEFLRRPPKAICDSQRVPAHTEQALTVEQMGEALNQVSRPTTAESVPLRNPLDAVVGKWPGDETEEEITQALRDLS